LLDALELEAQVARHLVLIADELAAVHDADLSGTFEQKSGGNYQDRNRASSLDSRAPGQMAGGPGGEGFDPERRRTSMISSMAWNAEIADPATWVAITTVASVVTAFFFSTEW
jgi:hypothetical protein